MVVVGIVAVAVLAGGCTRHVKTGRRVIVLGVDGLDYELVRDLMARGRMPNFVRIAQAGGRFSALQPSTPPQSPVAWSTFITGVDPGRHGIFDFVHRDPKTMEPFLSTTRTVGGARMVPVGRWQFPLRAGRVELLRRGESFWEVLERRGVETTIVRMPANFPPSGKATRELSGMGTPDMLGTYGTFSVFTSEPSPFRGKVVSGGTVVPVEIVGEAVRGASRARTIRFWCSLGKRRPGSRCISTARTGQHAKLVVGSEERLLRVGEWSDWVPVELDLLPLKTLSGECRFYLKRMDPFFELYVSPINIDPLQSGVAPVVAGRLRLGAGTRHRPLLHAGNARRHQEPEDRRAVPG